MLLDATPQLIETLLRLPDLNAAQLRELIHKLPDPCASAQEMVRRGWITQEQFASLFPEPQHQAHRETVLIGFGDDESPPDADSHDWDLIVSDDEAKAELPAGAESARPDRTDKEMPSEPETVEAIPILSEATSIPQCDSDRPVPRVARGKKTRHRRESETYKPPREWSGWVSKGLVMGTLFLGTMFTGTQFFRASSTVLARQDSTQAKAGDSTRAADVPPAPEIVPINNTKKQDDLPNSTEQKAAPAVPVVVPKQVPVQPIEAKPKPKPSLYARIRQVVRENRIVETERLGLGDIAYQNVPEDGSIMVGMEVTYVPFFNHNIIKSVRPIYQKPDGTRYDGPICGSPTKDVERVVAREGYAIGAAAIKPGMGIDGMQLTFMEIGPDGLNPNKSYLSKWLGGYGGTSARMYVNDGRPIIGIAGMRSSDTRGPAFCMCLVTIPAGAMTAPQVIANTSPPGGGRGPEGRSGGRSAGY
jgi:hypothetical protein